MKEAIAKEGARKFSMKLPSLEVDPVVPDMPKHLTLNQSRCPQYYFKNQKYLGFVPVIDVFEGPIFSRFHRSRAFLTEKICRNPDGSYCLNRELAKSWIRAEFTLKMIAHQFYNPLWPLIAPINPYPSNTKYYKNKSTLKKAINTAVFVQKLFLFLIAELWHNIAFSPYLHNTNLKMTWPQYLESLNKFDKGWLQNLAASKAMTTIFLAGYLIDPSQLLAYCTLFSYWNEHQSKTLWQLKR